MARVAIEAALRAQAEQARKVEAQVAQAFAPAAGAQPAFASSLGQAVAGLEQNVRAVDALPAELVTGKVGDFHEVVARLKQSELTFKFALEVRNKLIDAYRETMRMSV